MSIAETLQSECTACSISNLNSKLKKIPLTSPPKVCNFAPLQPPVRINEAEMRQTKHRYTTFEPKKLHKLRTVLRFKKNLKICHLVLFKKSKLVQKTRKPKYIFPRKLGQKIAKSLDDIALFFKSSAKLVQK